MGEKYIEGVMLGKIEDGEFIPIGEINSVDSFEDAQEEQYADKNTIIKLLDSDAYECICYMSKKSRKQLEQMLVYGWQNKMPFRRRTLKKALRNKINSNSRWFVQ